MIPILILSTPFSRYYQHITPIPHAQHPKRTSHNGHLVNWREKCEPYGNP